MSSHLNFDDERFRDRADVLRAMFVNSITSQIAAEKLAALADDCIEGSLSKSWGMITVAAKAFPEHHDLLVQLLVCMSQLPPVADEHGQTLKLYDMQLWADLPMFGWQLRDEWNGPDHETGREPSEAAITEFVNINRFVAKLTVSGVAALNYRLYALWTLRNAVEYTVPTPPMARPDIDEADGFPSSAYIPAAAAWIAVAGREIFSWTDLYPHGPSIGAPGRGGKYWDSKHGFCKERWMLWRKRFGDIAALSPEIPEHLRLICRDTESAMTEIELEMS